MPGMADSLKGWKSAAGNTDNPIVHDIPPWLQYFTQDWMNKSKSAPMKYLEGWQEDARVPNYNAPLAFLNNMPEAVQWNDVGPAGARWHGYSTTPAGQWLKEPTGTEAHWQYEAEMRNQIDQAKENASKTPYQGGS
jgi:hypothetical protein